MNEWAGAAIPFLFIIDFEQSKPLIFRLDEINPDQLLYDINGTSNAPDYTPESEPCKAGKIP